jgi:hypothetical protein
MDLSVNVQETQDKKWKLIISNHSPGYTFSFSLDSAENFTLEEWGKLCKREDVRLGDGPLVSCSNGVYSLYISSEDETYGEGSFRLEIEDPQFSTKLKDALLIVAEKELYMTTL